ncbi:hypothetical protein HID58_091682, partial [Brassica napus]
MRMVYSNPVKRVAIGASGGKGKKRKDLSFFEHDAKIFHLLREILDIIKSGEDFRIATTTKMLEQGTCERCGYISSQLRKLQEKTLSLITSRQIVMFACLDYTMKCRNGVKLMDSTVVCLRWVSEEREEALSLTHFPMHSVWNVPGRTSGENPPAFASGEPPPILPPDPPDPASPLSPVNFPSLTAATTKTASSGPSRKGTRKDSKQLPFFSSEKKQDDTTGSKTTSMEIEQENSSSTT